MLEFELTTSWLRVLTSRPCLPLYSFIFALINLTTLWAVLAFYSDDPSSNPAEANSFFLQNVVRNIEKNKKEAGLGQFFLQKCCHSSYILFVIFSYAGKIDFPGNSSDCRKIFASHFRQLSSSWPDSTWGQRRSTGWPASTTRSNRCESYPEPELLKLW